MAPVNTMPVPDWSCLGLRQLFEPRNSDRAGRNLSIRLAVGRLVWEGFKGLESLRLGHGDSGAVGQIALES